MRLPTALLLCVLAIAPVCIAQSDTQPSTGRASISGIVVRGDTGAPLENAEVSLTSSSRSWDQTIRITGADGRFTFDQLSADDYTVSATHRRFINPAQSLPIKVSLKPTERLHGLGFRLVPGAVIHGKVLDQDGEPLVGTRVKLLVSDYSRATTQFTQVNSADVNDLGEYRIFGIPPGYYYLTAHAPGTATDGRSVDSQTARPTTYRRMYFDNVTSAHDAKRIHLTVGSDFSADFKLVRARTATVNLTVVSPSYSMQFQGYVGMVPAEPYLSESLVYKETREPTKASFKAVTPGRYVIGGLLAAKKPDDSELVGVAAQETEIEEGLNEITVPVTSVSIETSAQVVFDSDKHPSPEGMDILLLPLRGQLVILDEEKGHKADVDDTGQFKLEQRTGITYAPVIEDLKSCPNCYIKSVRQNGKDVTTTGLVSQQDGAHVQITIATDAATITGRVLDDNGLPIPNSEVVALPDADNRRTYHCIASDTTSHDGRFRITSLCPGSYSVVALPSEAPAGIFWEPDVARSLEPLGLPVTLTPNNTQTLEVHPVPLPEY